MARMAEDAKHGDYRSRARDEYNNRRAEGRLGEHADRIMRADFMMALKSRCERSGSAFPPIFLPLGPCSTKMNA